MSKPNVPEVLVTPIMTRFIESQLRKFQICL